jgi:hypothetical protein
MASSNTGNDLSQKFFGMSVASADKGKAPVRADPATNNLLGPDSAPVTPALMPPPIFRPLASALSEEPSTSNVLPASADTTSQVSDLRQLSPQAFEDLILGYANRAKEIADSNEVTEEVVNAKIITSCIQMLHALDYVSE